MKEKRCHFILSDLSVEDAFDILSIELEKEILTCGEEFHINRTIENRFEKKIIIDIVEEKKNAFGEKKKTGRFFVYDFKREEIEFGYLKM